MKDKNCVDPKMAAYCQAVRNLEDKFYGSSLIMYYATTTRPLTYSRRPHPVAAQSLMESSQVISMLPLSAQRGRSPLRSKSPKSWDRPATRAEP
jgi:hypothetical protein